MAAVDVVNDIDAVIRPKKAIKKAVKPAKKKCNVPSKREGTTTRFWPIHIYAMMKEASPALLEREDVIDAYNHFVECIDTYNGTIYTLLPSSRVRYALTTIKVNKRELVYAKLLRITTKSFAQQEKEMEDNIYTAYYPLYELIKRDVVPYMEKKDHERKVEEARKQSIKDIQRLKELEVRYAEQYQSAVKCYERNMKYTQDAISEISRRLNDVTTSFHPTVFD